MSIFTLPVSSASPSHMHALGSLPFSSTKANALGLPLEFHRAAHTAFESEQCLLETLRLGMDLLARAVQNATTVGNALMNGSQVGSRNQTRFFF